MIRAGRHNVTVQVIALVPTLVVEVQVQLDSVGGKGVNKFYMDEFANNLKRTLQNEILLPMDHLDTDYRYQISYDAIIEIGRNTLSFNRWKTLTLRIEDAGYMYFPFPGVLAIEGLNLDDEIDSAWGKMEQDYVEKGSFQDPSKPKKKFRSGGSKDVSDDYDLHRLIIYFYKEFVPPAYTKTWTYTLDGRFRSLRAFNIFGEQLLSFQYSDFSQKNISLSNTYGLCLFETLEYIRQDGRVLDRIIYEKNLFQQELFFQQLRQCMFTQEQIMVFLSGDLFEACQIYKRKFQNIDFAIYISYTDEIYYFKMNRLVKYDKWNEEEMHRVELFKRSKWWLVYEKMHVVPMLGEQIIKFVQKRNKIAENFKYMNKFLMKDQIILEDQLEVRQNWILRNGRTNKTFFLNKSICRESLMKRYTKLNINTKSFQEFSVNFNFNLREIEGGKYLKQQQDLQIKQIQKSGIIVFDFETVKDNSLEYALVGNMRPVIIVCHGYYMYDTGVINKTDRASRVQRQDIDKIVFKGDTCVDDFITWIVDNRILQQSYSSKNQKKKDLNPSKYLRNYKNYFVAHNGARFDFRFILNKLAKFAQLDITGTKNQIRKLKFKNVEFLDSFQLLPFSLKKLCESFNTVNKKFPYDIENVTVDNWREKEEQLIKYCHMDCKSLYEIYTKYIFGRATTYHNNKSFPRKLFPMTQSAAALDVLQSAYLDYNLEIYPETYDYEMSSYFGGAVCPYELSCEFAATFDANSMYPSVMHQNAPLKPILQESTQSYVIEYDYPVVISQQGQDNVDNNDLFLCTFDFPQDCRYPSITIRNNSGTLINPISSRTQKIWIWGITINVAVQRQNCVVKVYQRIQYESKPVFKQFIQQMFKDRLEAQARGDSLNDFLIKLLMNSSYGKLGQKINPQSFHGTQQQILEFCQQQREKDNGFEILSIVPFMGTGHQIYEVKYVEDGLKFQQIGGLCRFAAYITAASRANLYRGMQLMQDELGQYFPEQNVVTYCDTDSMCVRLDVGFSEEQKQQLRVLNQESEVLSNELTTNKKQIDFFVKQNTLFNENLIDDIIDTGKNLEKINLLQDYNKHIQEKLMVNYNKIKSIYNANQLYRKIYDIEDFDARDFTGFQMNAADRMGHTRIKLLDESICGAYKQEKFVIEGYFLGAKFYAMKSFDTKSKGLLMDVCKMKGIQEFNRKFEHYRQMHSQIINVNADVNIIGQNISHYVKLYEQQQFRVLDGGVRIQQIMKIIVPTLTKRVYYKNRNNEWTSRAFNDMVECEIIQQKVYDLNNQVKALYKQQQSVQQKIIDNKQLPDNQVALKDKFIFTQIKNNSELKLIQEQTDLNIVASPIYITKITFFNLMEQYFGWGKNQDKLRDIYIESKTEYYQKFQVHILQENCKNSQVIYQIVFAVYFMANICQFMTQQRQSFQNLITYIENKVQKVLSKKKQWFNLNADFVTLIQNDIQRLLVFINDELKQQIDYDHISNNQYYMTKYFENQIQNIEQMCDNQIEQQQKKFDNQTTTKINNKYLKINDTQQKLEEVYRFLHEMNEQTKQNLQKMFHIHSIQFHSKRKCMLLLIRQVILKDPQFLYGTWDSQNNYSKLSKKSGLIIDKFVEMLQGQGVTNQLPQAQQEDDLQIRTRQWQNDWEQFVNELNTV